MNDKNDMQAKDENYFCHIVIPSKNYQKSKIFFEKVFGWKVQKVPGSKSLDVLKLIGEFGGKGLKGKTPIGENAEYEYYALFEDPQGNRMALYSEK